MITSIMKTINDAVQITAKAIAFVVGILLAIICWPLIKIIQLTTTTLWWIAFIPSWIGGKCLMFALDLDPAKTMKECETREKLRVAKALIQEILREEKKAPKEEAEKTDDPS